MFKVKLSFPYPEWNLVRQTPKSSGCWKNYQFYINGDQEEFDYWFVFNGLLHPHEKAKCAKENTVLITAEPFCIQQYDRKFTDQFGHVITCQREIKHPKVTYFLQGHPWFVGSHYENGSYSAFSKSYDELVATSLIPKSKTISIVSSNKAYTEGHKKRLDFAMALKGHFGAEIDLFGRGIRDFSDKWDVLANYKYAIAIENTSTLDYASEKIIDCYLAHTFPIYYGCPNLSSYFPESTFQTINIDDWESSKKNIEALLNNPNHYSQVLPELIMTKKLYLDTYNLFPLIVNFIEEQLKPRKATDNTLFSEFEPTLVEKITRKLKSLTR